MGIDDKNELEIGDIVIVDNLNGRLHYSHNFSNEIYGSRQKISTKQMSLSEGVMCYSLSSVGEDGFYTGPWLFIKENLKLESKGVSVKSILNKVFNYEV